MRRAHCRNAGGALAAVGGEAPRFGDDNTMTGLRHKYSWLR